MEHFKCQSPAASHENVIHSLNLEPITPKERADGGLLPSCGGKYNRKRESRVLKYLLVSINMSYIVINGLEKEHLGTWMKTEAKTFIKWAKYIYSLISYKNVII